MSKTKKTEKTVADASAGEALQYYESALGSFGDAVKTMAEKHRLLGRLIFADRFGGNFLSSSSDTLANVVFPELDNFELEKSALVSAYRQNSNLVAVAKANGEKLEGKARAKQIELKSAKRAVGKLFKDWSAMFTVEEAYVTRKGEPSLNGFIIPTNEWNPDVQRKEEALRQKDPDAFNAKMDKLEKASKAEELRKTAINNIVKDGDDSINSSIRGIKDIGAKKKAICHAQAESKLVAIREFAKKQYEELAKATATKLS